MNFPFYHSKTNQQLYQFGQFFTTEDPKVDGYEFKKVYETFQKTKQSNIINKNFFLKDKNIDLRTNDFYRSRYAFYNDKDINVALSYPVKWIIHSNQQERENQEQSSHLDLSYYKNTYLKKQILDGDIGTWNKHICNSGGALLFRHQQFIKYVMRPYSPIRSLIINSRTGSGKTRMIQVALNNFACFPNLKIVLFSTATIRESFYNEYIRKPNFENIYHIPADIERIVKTDEEGNDYEKFDDFNVKYSLLKHDQKITVKNRYDHPLFEDYYDMFKKGDVMGATLILTFNEFYQMCTNNDVYGCDHLYDQITGKLNFGGATVLIDEAHLIFNNDNTSIRIDKIRQILEQQAPHLHTIGLFTATPFINLHDIKKYTKILNVPQRITTSESIAKNYMMYYSKMENIENIEHLFNKENNIFIGVKPSDILVNRGKKLDIENEKDFFRLSKHCWFTQFDMVDDLEGWNNYAVARGYEMPNEFNAANWKTFDIQYNNIMKLTFSKAGFNLLKIFYPKIGYALEKVYEQYKQRKLGITLFKWCKQKWTHLPRIQDKKWDKYTNDVIKLFKNNNTMSLLDNIILPSQHNIERASKRGDTDVIKEWKHYVDEKLEELYDDRIVIMTNFDHGLIEFSKLLVNENIPHTILQIEGSSEKQTGKHNQLQLYDTGFDKSKVSTNGVTYMDDELVKFVNSNKENIPVILFNSHIPEGISLYHTRNLHILTMDTTYANILQMMGRINRLCRTTKKKKDIYMYVFTDSKEQLSFSTEEKKQNSWPYLNSEE